MNIEKMREEFEFAIRNGGFFHDATEAAKDAYLECGSNGQYRSLQVNGAWWGWQASRESLVIELPYVASYPANEASSDQDYYLDEAKSDMRHQCRKAIEAAGLKVRS